MTSTYKVVSILLPCLLLILCTAFCQAQAARNTVEVVFIEPETTAVACEHPAYTRVTDTERLSTYNAWLNNDVAQWAVALYLQASQMAHDLSTRGGQPAVYYIALVPGGNHADIGFCLREGSEMRTYPLVPYVKLAPEDWVFTTTFLHETGHVVLSLLNGGQAIPKREIASISHSVAALTDRGTAFDEGFAIHLETLAARFSADPVVRGRYHHDRYLFGIAHIQSEYHRQAADLLTFAQTRARYYDVGENSFAFGPSFTGADYLRTQLEKTRDFSSVRDANQLLQSEGFYASFFYSFLMQGKGSITIDTVQVRQDKVLRAVKAMMGMKTPDSESPFLLDFIVSYINEFPHEAPDAVNVLLELSHGVFVDPQAAALWRRHYLAALSLDLGERSNDTINMALARWRENVLQHPGVLYALLGPQLRCTVPDLSIKLAAFPEALPLSFDVNTAEAGVLRKVPHICEDEIDSWLRERASRPFSDPADFAKRTGVRAKVLSHMQF